MLDHVSLFVDDFQKGLEFYDSLLEPLNIKRFMTFKSTAGYGTEHSKFFWITAVGALPSLSERRKLGLHIAFHAPERLAIDRWYENALKLGAMDNGKPGIREEYHPNYYAAYIVDIHGWPLEAVCHHPLENEGSMAYLKEFSKLIT
ncbi:VOC family protein [Candidatus Paracaedibacter symbiosus]|uniref:VOC family protein n=1 Tax=Candidatus Paracaedibacter symbiosus TaxID=244582 RepID=UPI000691FBB2|nr:VOC family protein [Candidatus Paracaedibacter symbiosus]